MHIRPGLPLVVLALAVGLLSGNAGAEPKSYGAVVPLRPGDTVTKMGLGSFTIGGSAYGEKGTFSCSCAGGAGSCSIVRQTGGIVCGAAGDSCKGKCKLTTTTSGGLGISPF